MEQNHPFLTVLGKIEKRILQMNREMELIRLCCRENRMPAAYEEAIHLEENAEKMVLLARVLPAYTGSPRAAKDVENVMKETIPVDIGFTGEGWFSLRIPAILPKKESGSPDYIRAYLYPVMREFFQNREPIRYRDCVLVYRHVYAHDRPERRKRDHDNIETNMVTDIIAMYVLVDDAPGFCSHFACSVEGDEERTEVYVVPKQDFPQWLKQENEMPDSGVQLFGTRSEQRENQTG